MAFIVMIIETTVKNYGELSALVKKLGFANLEEYFASYIAEYGEKIVKEETNKVAHVLSGLAKLEMLAEFEGFE